MPRANCLETPAAPIIRPEWIRLPSPGDRCPHTGLGRHNLWSLVKSGKVKTTRLGPKSAKRAVRVVHLQSLLSYLESESEGGAT